MQSHRCGRALESMLVMVAVIAACFVPIGCTSRAETTKYDQQFREMVISAPVYSITTSSVSRLDEIPGTQVLTSSQWKDMTQRVLAMSDTSFEEYYRSRLIQMIAYSKNPAKDVRVKWNAEVVSKMVSRVAPDLEAAINVQIEAQKTGGVIHEEQATVSPQALIPGSNTITPSVVVSSAGNRLYGLYCRIHWEWDSYHITSVLPSSYGEVYAPTWTDAGLNATQGYYNTDQTVYYKWVEWHFIHWSVYPGGIPLENAYPELNIEVHAGGSSDY